MKSATMVLKYIMMSRNGNAFHVTGSLWMESTGHWWFPSQKAGYVDFDVSFEIVE